MIETWGDTVRELVLAARKTIDDVVCSQAVEANGVMFEDGETVEMLLNSLRRGLNDKNTAMAYQVSILFVPRILRYPFPCPYQAVVDSVLLRPHSTDSEADLLSSTSHVCVQVEQARIDIIRYIRRR